MGDLNDGVNDEPGDVSLRVGAGGTAKVTGPLEVEGIISSTDHVAGRWRRFNAGSVTCLAGGAASVDWNTESYAEGGMALLGNGTDISVPETGLYRVEAVGWWPRSPTTAGPT